MTEGRSGSRWPWAAGAGMAIALGVWFAVGLGRETPAAQSSAEAVQPADPSPPPRALRAEPTATSDAEVPALPTTLRPEDEVVALESAPIAESAGEVLNESESSPEGSIAVSAGEPEPAGPGRPAPPAQRIADGGRLSIDALSLRDGEVLALGLGLSDEARGEELLAVRLVSVDGRRIETTAAPASGSGSGVRLEIDPEWLTPGRYLVEVSTAEKSHFPIRRYVLEVTK
jgi:hypothetical protein